MCLGLGGRECRPVRSRLSPVPLQILTHICHILVHPSDCLGPGVELSIPCLSHHPLFLISLPHEKLGPAPSVFPLPLCCPHILPEITPAGPSPFPITWYLALIAPPEGPIFPPPDRRMSPSTLS